MEGNGMDRVKVLNEKQKGKGLTEIGGERNPSGDKM